MQGVDFSFNQVLAVFNIRSVGTPRGTMTSFCGANTYCPLGLLCRDPSNFPVRPASVCLSVVCLSVVCHTQFWTPSERNLLAWDSIRGQNRVRFGHFCVSSLDGRQSKCPTCPLPSLSRVIVTCADVRKKIRVVPTQYALKGHPCPAGVI